jgi:hypothetical protein
MPWAVQVTPTKSQHQARVVESGSGFRRKKDATRVCKQLNSFLLNLFMQRIEPKDYHPDDHQNERASAQ